MRATELSVDCYLARIDALIDTYKKKSPSAKEKHGEKFTKDIQLDEARSSSGTEDKVRSFSQSKSTNETEKDNFAKDENKQKFLLSAKEIRLNERSPARNEDKGRFLSEPRSTNETEKDKSMGIGPQKVEIHLAKDNKQGRENGTRLEHGTHGYRTARVEDCFDRIDSVMGRLKLNEDSEKKMFEGTEMMKATQKIALDRKSHQLRGATNTGGPPEKISGDGPQKIGKHLLTKDDKQWGRNGTSLGYGYDRAARVEDCFDRIDYVMGRLKLNEDSKKKMFQVTEMMKAAQNTPLNKKSHELCDGSNTECPPEKISGADNDNVKVLERSIKKEAREDVGQIKEDTGIRKTFDGATRLFDLSSRSETVDVDVDACLDKIDATIERIKKACHRA